MIPSPTGFRIGTFSNRILNWYRLPPSRRYIHIMRTMFVLSLTLRGSARPASAWVTTLGLSVCWLVQAWQLSCFGAPDAGDPLLQGLQLRCPLVIRKMPVDVGLPHFFILKVCRSQPGCDIYLHCFFLTIILRLLSFFAYFPFYCDRPVEVLCLAP